MAINSLLTEVIPLVCEACGAPAERKVMLEMAGMRGIEVPKGAPRPTMLCPECRGVGLEMIVAARALMAPPLPVGGTPPS